MQLKQGIQGRLQTEMRLLDTGVLLELLKQKDMRLGDFHTDASRDTERSEKRKEGSEKSDRRELQCLQSGQ
jgi:hypothetical protein